MRSAEELVNEKINDKLWSTRIWSNVDELRTSLSKTMKDSLVTHHNPVTQTNELRKRFGVLKSQSERILRTESSRVMAQSGIDNIKEAGYDKVVWVANSKACDECQANIGKVYTLKQAESILPYHPNCRCAWSAWYDPNENNEVLQNDSSNIEDFSNDDLASQVGDENYKNLKNRINSKDFDPRLKAVLTKYQNKFKFDYVKQKWAFGNESAHYSALNKKILVYRNDFEGERGFNPLQSVFHEMGHAIDNFATKDILGEEFVSTGKQQVIKVLGKKTSFDKKTVHISSSEKYDFSKIIEQDLNDTIYKGIPDESSLGVKPKRRGTARTEWYDKSLEIYRKRQEARDTFANKIRNDIKANDDEISRYTGLSDMLESTKDFYTDPLGAGGHGLSYWSNSGMQQTEFIAHMTESVAANPDLLAELEKYFPKASKAYFDLLEDIAKEGK